MLGRSPPRCFEVGCRKVLFPRAGLGRGRILAAEEKEKPLSPLPERDKPEALWSCWVSSGGGVEYRQCSSRPARETAGAFEAKKEEGKAEPGMPLLMRVPVREGATGWQLFKPAAVGSKPNPAGPGQGHSGMPAGQSLALPKFLLGSMDPGEVPKLTPTGFL